MQCLQSLPLVLKLPLMLLTEYKMLAAPGSPEPEAFEDREALQKNEEEVEDAMQLEAATAQCLYLRYNLDLDYRNAKWGGNYPVIPFA